MLYGILAILKISGDNAMSKLSRLPDLPYSLDDLEPHIPKETLSYNHDKHHFKLQKFNTV